MKNMVCAVALEKSAHETGGLGGATYRWVRSGVAGLMMGAVTVATTTMTLADTSASISQTAPAHLTVMGQGEVFSAPDMAFLNLGVTTSGVSAAEALAQNSEILRAVIAKLKEAGIEDRHLQTQGVSVYPQWDDQNRVAGQPTKILSYSASNQLDVQVLDLPKLGVILDTALASGANTVNGPRFAFQDMRSLNAQAMHAAIQDGQEKARQMADALGLKLGQIKTVTEGGGGYGSAKMVRSAQFDSATPIQAGEISGSAAVTMEFELLP